MSAVVEESAAEGGDEGYEDEPVAGGEAEAEVGEAWGCVSGVDRDWVDGFGKVRLGA